MSTTSERLRFRSVAHALWSLRGEVEGEIPPTERGIFYRRGRHTGIAPQYDVYLPQRPNGSSVVLVHGGGFFIGSRTMKPMRRLAASLSAAGVAVCSVDYRLVFRGGRLDEALDDVRAALAHFRGACPSYDLDPQRVSIAGLSAGATLTLLAAAQDAAVHRVISCFGLYELDHLEGPLARVLPRLVFRSSDRATWSARSPRGAMQPSAPTLLLHGTADGLVPHGQAERLAAHRASLGLPTRLVLYPGAPHGFFNQPGEPSTSAISEILAHLS